MEIGVNQVINNRYEIQEIIGVGGMSRVYKAYDRVDDRIVALKVLKDEYLENYKAPRHISIATGVAAYDTIKAMAVDLEARIEGLQIDVYKIINHFFGETITVSGLLTGKDISEQLSGKNLGDLLIFPANALRSGEDIFLDDMTPEQLSAALGVPVSPSKEGGEGFICAALGVEHQI